MRLPYIFLTVTFFLVVFFAAPLNSFASENTPYTSNKPNFPSIKNIQERKTIFFKFLLPKIQIINTKILTERKKLHHIYTQHKTNQNLLSPENKQWLNKLSLKYKLSADSSDPFHWVQLFQRVDVIPPSLALAQAANESGWGTSRFAVEGNNFFGEWCFIPNCGLKPKQRPPGRLYEVRRFTSADQSIASYMLNINTHQAYKDIRNKRSDSRENNNNPSGLKLSSGLVHYSARGELYIKEIQSIINYNNLKKYDTEY